MSTPRKYEIGQTINNWEIIDLKTGSKTPYIVKCKCGEIKIKNTQSLTRNKGCLRCSYKERPVRNAKRKFKIGDQVYKYKIIGLEHLKNKILYHCQCFCGNVEKKYSTNVEKYECCQKCRRKIRTDKHIGKIYNNFTVTDNIQEGDKTLLKVQCNNCSEVFLKTKSSMRNNKWCPNCIQGYFPGKIIDGITLLERIGKSKWQLKCKCGNLFANYLRKYNGKIASCGCRRREEILEKVSKKIGLKYKHLKINKIKGFKDNHLWLEMKCVCNKTFLRPNGNEFKSESCGCRWHEKGPKGENSHFSKLNEIEVKSMRELFESDCYSICDLSEIFNVSNENVKLIIQRERWKHV